MTETFAGLTIEQQELFERIAVGDDIYRPVIIDELKGMGLIAEYTEREGIFTIYRYRVPISVHMQWCAWCAQHVTA